LWEGSARGGRTASQIHNNNKVLKFVLRHNFYAWIVISLHISIFYSIVFWIQWTAFPRILIGMTERALMILQDPC
jgi:hypothetical protein